MDKGILAYYRIFGLSKGPTYIHLEMISKVHHLFCALPMGIGDQNKSEIFFRISAHVYSLLGQTPGKSSFLEGAGKESAG